MRRPISHIIGAALTSVYSPNTTAKIHFVVSCRIYVIAMDEIYIYIVYWIILDFSRKQQKLDFLFSLYYSIYVEKYIILIQIISQPFRYCITLVCVRLCANKTSDLFGAKYWPTFMFFVFLSHLSMLSFSKLKCFLIYLSQP